MWSHPSQEGVSPIVQEYYARAGVHRSAPEMGGYPRLRDGHAVLVST